MATNHSHEQDLKEADERIDWVLSHPGMSDWLKQALRATRDRDPVDVLNELEMLCHLLKPRPEAQIAQSLSKVHAQTPEQRNDERDPSG